MERVRHVVDQVAPTSMTVLITGESGTGKDVVARLIHERSHREGRPFVAVNCAALPEGVLESELFGHEKGAFTGAIAAKTGLFEQANGGSIFLDEIGNISPNMQAKLLRVLQEHEVKPVGSTRSIKVDIRVLSATNRDLKELVDEGKFREDLYYRLNILTIPIPPLRERSEDIPSLVWHFVKKYAREFRKDISKVSAEAMNLLVSHNWPGNVRELENTMERAILLSSGKIIDPSNLPENIAAPGEEDSFDIPRTSDELKELKKELRRKSIEDIERLFVTEALKRNEWNASKAAEDVGMLRPNFQALMKKHNIKMKEKE